MYNGVKAMIEAEKELAAAAAPKEEVKVEEPVQEAAPSDSEPAATIQAGPHLKSTSDITGFPVFPEGTHSLLSKYMTKEVFEKYHK
jgi:hypothetical protein